MIEMFMKWPFAQLLPGLETGHPVTVGQSLAYDFSVSDEQKAVFLASVSDCSECDSYAGDWPRPSPDAPFLTQACAQYSETRLLRTLKGNEKRYVVTKVCSIQNAILLTGRTGSTCSRERSATEDASPSWMSFITRFSYGEIAFQCIVNLKTCREVEIETERRWKKCSWSEKKSQRKAKKCSWREKWYVISDFMPRSVRLIRKKMYMFSDWRCSWSTERTL